MKSKFLEILKTGKFKPEHREAISKANTGKTISEETRRKMSESHKGMKYTPESKPRRQYKKFMYNFKVPNMTPEKFQELNKRLR